MVKRTKPQLLANQNTQLPDNTTGEITPAEVRENFNDVVDSLARVIDTNAITMTGTVTITSDDESFYILDPNGADRNLVLDSSIETTDRFLIISHVGATNTITVQNSSLATVVSLTLNTYAILGYDGVGAQWVFISAGDIGSLTADVTDLINLSGVPANAVDLGTFTGTIIADNETVKGALQDLETPLETHIDSTTNPHSVTATQVGLGNVTDNAQLTIANNLSDVAVAATAFDNIKQDASETTTGVAEIATQVETDAGTDDTRFVTPLKLANFPTPSPFDQDLNTTDNVSFAQVTIPSRPLLVGTTAPIGTSTITAASSLSTAAFILNLTNAAYASFGHVIRTTRAAATTFWHAAYQTANGADNEFLFRGDGNGFCDGSWTGGGADYAEYFEWLDGNPDEEDRRGWCVTLTGDKIKRCEEGENPIGVISGNPSVIGDAAWDSWSEKYLRDDFGSYLKEDFQTVAWEEGEEVQSYDVEKLPLGLEVPSDAKYTTEQRKILNPLYSESVEYTPREFRKEWDIVGLMGKLRVLKGEHTSDNWIKMRDVSDTVEEWLVK